MPKVVEYKLTHPTTGDKVHVHQYHIRCPGCNCTHAIGAKIHSFNGNFDKPTFQPSLLVRGTEFTEKGKAEYEAWVAADYPDRGGKKFDSKPQVCHSYVTDGKIRFLNDCTHSLAGKTVELPEFTAEQKEA